MKPFGFLSGGLIQKICLGLCTKLIEINKSLTLEAHLFLHGKKSVLFGQKWRISAPGIIINNPKIIDLFSYKFYVGPHKGGFGIINYNTRHPYCPLVPKQYTLRAAKGSPQYGGSLKNQQKIQKN